MGAGVISAGANIFGSQSAANAQTTASNNATQAQLAEFNQEQATEAPYVAAGTNAQNMLTAALPSLTAPINMSEATLQETPGYQFNLTQGLKSTQSSAAARGLGTSGAALKGAATYATGLADSTYQNQFNNAQTNRTTAYNDLAGVSQLGQAAAANVGSAAIQTGNSVASNILGAGNATAAADTASGSAVGSAASSASNAYLLNNLLSGSANNAFASADATQDRLQDAND